MPCCTGRTVTALIRTARMGTMATADLATQECTACRALCVHALYCTQLRHVPPHVLLVVALAVWGPRSLAHCAARCAADVSVLPSQQKLQSMCEKTCSTALFSCDCPEASKFMLWLHGCQVC